MQYHLIVNLDRREYLRAPDFHGGNQTLVGFDGRALHALLFLLAENSRSYEGDFRILRKEFEGLLGRWCRDRITVVGDYGDAGDGQMYDEAIREWFNVSLLVRGAIDPAMGPFSLDTAHALLRTLATKPAAVRQGPFPADPFELPEEEP